MSDKEDRPSRRRRYPPFYERWVPIALVVILVLMTALVLIIFGVALGLVPGLG